tara:strand:- start:586 stop:897 length:312 start_codon:yes stop_codon:yes gene_type:complete
MVKFRKKPVVIEAIQLTESNIKECYEIVNKTKVDLSLPIASDKWDDYEKIVIDNGLDVPTLEDGKDKRVKHVASIGDYIIKGVQGEFYPCKPDIFKQTYDVVL